MSIELKLLVFDWDGTLMDSERQIVDCMQHSIRDMELESRTDNEVRNIIGLGLWEAIDTLYPGRDDSFHTSFTERYRHYWFRSHGTSQMFDGAKDTVQTLGKAGYQLAVATGKGRAGLNKVLAETGMESTFHATRCADESGSKPHPAMLEEIMDELMIAPENTLMIGDTEYDLEMASNAGAHSVGVAYGVHSTERLLEHKPLAILHNITELDSWLEKRAGT